MGGDIVEPNSWPWQVALKQSGSIFCGGTLLDQNWVLTAAHCEYKPQTVQVVLGEHSLGVVEASEQVFSVAKWISHPRYSPSDMGNDVALIKLNRRVTFSNVISPVCLPRGAAAVVGSNGVVTGWVSE